MNHLEEAKKKISEALDRGKVRGVLALRKTEAGTAPFVFETKEEVASLVIEPKWLLAKTAASILRTTSEDYTLGILCRGCDERALVELSKRNQVARDRLLIIGMACSREQAEACLCPNPRPSRIDIGEPAQGVDPLSGDRTGPFLDGNLETRRKQWARVLDRCIKCYGCRNACPLCQCNPCKLEEDLWVDRGRIPADRISYHLIRAFHLADTCVGCGACEDACPVHIPLKLLQVSMMEALRKDYAYEAGTDQDRLSPILPDLFNEPHPAYTEPGWIDSMRPDHET